MTKTLAQLKRDIQVGTKITLSMYINIYTDGTQTDDIPEKMQGTRTVVKVNTTGFYMSKDPTKDPIGSFCGYPPALKLKYIDDTFKITNRHHVTKEIVLVREYFISK